MLASCSVKCNLTLATVKQSAEPEEEHFGDLDRRGFKFCVLLGATRRLVLAEVLAARKTAVVGEFNIEASGLCNQPRPCATPAGGARRIP